MILCDGKGERLKPITNSIPKPLVRVGDLTTLERSLRKLEGINVSNFVFNTFYMSEKIEDYIIRRQEFYRQKTILYKISREEKLLDTGGGVLIAINKGLLNYEEPFLVFNSDIIYFDKLEINSLKEMKLVFFSCNSLVTLMLAKNENINGFDNPISIYNFLSANSNMVLRNSETNCDYTYVGISIINPTIFKYKKNESDVFSISELFQVASDLGKLSGLRFTGEIFSIDRPDNIIKLEKIIKQFDEMDNY